MAKKVAKKKTTTKKEKKECQNKECECQPCPCEDKCECKPDDCKCPKVAKKEKKSQFKLSPDVIIGSGGIVLEGEEEISPDDQSLYHIVSIDKLSEENKRIGDVPNKNIDNNKIRD